MALPVADGHDVTNASGTSMKQYEEQLYALRKENFHLKLRVYFLEEKLGTGSPPAVQGLLEHNVRLQVEGSISTDSVENMSMNNCIALKKDTTQDQIPDQKDVTYDTCAESESAGDYLAVTVNNEDLDELARLRRENRKALQMIKGCMKKIQQQDKEMKKIKLDKELTYAQVSDSQLEKYQEILKCKDEHIKDLESKLRELQRNYENKPSTASNSCVLGEDKKRLAESILEQSLALPVGLELDESMAPDEFTMDESNLEVSQTLRLEDLTAMFGHHVTCADDHDRYSTRKPMKYLPMADVISESECWSEPDRNVSLARVGLCDTGLSTRDSVSDETKFNRSRRAKLSYGSRSDEKTSPDAVDNLNTRCETLEREKLELNGKLQFTIQEIEELSTENRNIKENLETERINAAEADKHVAALRSTILSLESQLKDVEQKLTDSVKMIEVMRSERQELEATFLEKERSLRRAADEATLQASQVALERARAQHDRLRIEKELEETRDKLSSVMEFNSQLEMEVTRRVGQDVDDKMLEVHEGVPSEEERPTSPDQGIDSDRLSSLEQNDAGTLAETLTQLNAANMRKRSVQRAICREIHKTQGVLRKARDQFENQN
ncbi:Centrosomin, partial [Operophtera brumata]